MAEILKLKCPSCRSKDYTLVEIFEEIVIHSVRGGVMPDKADDHIAGSFLGTRCECEQCGHKWKPRSIADWRDTIAT